MFVWNWSTIKTFPQLLLLFGLSFDQLQCLQSDDVEQAPALQTPNHSPLIRLLRVHSLPGDVLMQDIVLQQQFVY